MKDEIKISNQWSELTHAAKHLGVKEWQILKAKFDLKTNDRQKIYSYFTKPPKSNKTIINELIKEIASYSSFSWNMFKFIFCRSKAVKRVNYPPTPEAMGRASRVNAPFNKRATR